jgi:hypothetical protein
MDWMVWDSVRGRGVSTYLFISIKGTGKEGSHIGLHRIFRKIKIG